MSMSASEKRIVELLRALGRTRATVAHMTAHSGQVDDDLLVMAEELAGAVRCGRQCGCQPTRSLPTRSSRR